MNNKLTDLNNHLFAQMERLSDESVTGDKLLSEIDRSKAVISVAKEIVSNASLQLSALRLQAEYNGLKKGESPEIFALEHKTEHKK